MTTKLYVKPKELLLQLMRNIQHFKADLYDMRKLPDDTPLPEKNSWGMISLRWFFDSFDTETAVELPLHPQVNAIIRKINAVVWAGFNWKKLTVGDMRHLAKMLPLIENFEQYLRKILPLVVNSSPDISLNPLLTKAAEVYKRAGQLNQLKLVKSKEIADLKQDLIWVSAEAEKVSKAAGACYARAAGLLQKAYDERYSGMLNADFIKPMLGWIEKGGLTLTRLSQAKALGLKHGLAAFRRYKNDPEVHWNLTKQTEKLGLNAQFPIQKTDELKTFLAEFLRLNARQQDIFRALYNAFSGQSFVLQVQDGSQLELKKQMGWHMRPAENGEGVGKWQGTLLRTWEDLMDWVEEASPKLIG